MRRNKNRARSSDEIQVPFESNFLASAIKPLTENQKLTFEYYNQNYNLLLHGTAGTGKTFITIYLALKEIITKEKYSKLVIVRSAVPTRNVGFMPGNLKEKNRMYEAPYAGICAELFGRADAYEVLKNKNIMQFTTTSYLRGTTLDDAIVVVDECQNMSDQELHTIMTRIGENSKIIFCGDTNQDDLTSERFMESSGLKKFMQVLKNMKEFAFVQFTSKDIVRSDLVKSYIIARENLNMEFTSNY